MYAQSNTAFSRAAGASVLMQQQQNPITEFDSLSQLNSCSSGYNSCSPTTPTPIPILKQRSFSSHSLFLHNDNGTHHHPLSPLFQDPPFRRVYSTGDLQLDSPLSSESSIIIEGMSRVSPYSPQEKKLRIERYRTKRNQRNFNKKIKCLNLEPHNCVCRCWCTRCIRDRHETRLQPQVLTYACRKTLADRRPRIRGRFARNDEINKNTKVQWSHIGVGEDEEDENWIISIFDSLLAANLAHDDSQGTSSFGLLY